MAIKPNPYKLVYPKCGFSKIVAPRSDALTSKDIINTSTTCAKCSSKMERVEINNLDKLFSFLN